MAELILNIIYGILGISMTGLFITMTVVTIRTHREDLARDKRKEQREQAEHEARMKEIQSAK